MRTINTSIHVCQSSLIKIPQKISIFFFKPVLSLAMSHCVPLSNQSAACGHMTGAHQIWAGSLPQVSMTMLQSQDATEGRKRKQSVISFPIGEKNWKYSAENSEGDDQVENKHVYRLI